MGFPPKSSILIGFSIFNHPFWGTTIFGNIHMLEELLPKKKINTEIVSISWMSREPWFIHKKHMGSYGTWIATKRHWIADSNKKIWRFGLLLAKNSKTSIKYELDTVDGRHPAPPDTCETPWIWGYFTYEQVSRISEPSIVVWRVSRSPNFCWWIIFQGELVIVSLAGLELEKKHRWT